MSHQDSYYKNNEAYAEHLAAWNPQLYAKYADTLKPDTNGARALDGGRDSELVEQVAEAVDVGEARQVPQGQRLVGKERAGQQGQSRVLGPGNGDPALEALAAGEAVGLYPEGRITRDPAMWPERAKTGAVRLALRSGAPIVPIAMVGAHRVVSRRKIVTNLVKNLVLRPKVLVKVGEPIDVRTLVGDRDDTAIDVIREVADAVMSELVALVADLREELPEHPSGAVIDAAE